MNFDFPKKKAYNPGGLVSFELALHDAVGAFPFVSAGLAINPVILKGGQQWGLGYSTAYTLRFDEPSEHSAQGILYRPRITGYIPNDHAAVIDLMQRMEGQYFTVLIRDANRRKRLVGGYGYPLLFTASGSTGAQRADAKGFTYELTGASEIRAPEYLA